MLLFSTPARIDGDASPDCPPCKSSPGQSAAESAGLRVVRGGREDAESMPAHPGITSRVGELTRELLGLAGLVAWVGGTWWLLAALAAP